MQFIGVNLLYLCCQSGRLSYKMLWPSPDSTSWEVPSMPKRCPLPVQGKSGHVAQKHVLQPAHCSADGGMARDGMAQHGMACRSREV